MATDSRIGTEIAGYRIESLLGRGGMSVVYLAEQQFPRRKVALKLLAPDLAQDGSFRERFIRNLTTPRRSCLRPPTRWIDIVVEGAIRRVVDGTFEGGTYVGTLENGGVDLAPFHDLDGKVPQGLKTTLAQLEAGIADGTVSVDPKDYLS